MTAVCESGLEGAGWYGNWVGFLGCSFVAELPGSTFVVTEGFWVVVAAAMRLLTGVDEVAASVGFSKDDCWLVLMPLEIF